MVPFCKYFDKSQCCCCSVTMSCPTLCDPMDCSTPGSSVLHYIPEYAQILVHWVSDAIYTYHPLLPSSPFAFNFSQHQYLFQWVSSLHQVAKNYRASVSVIPMNIQGRFPLGLTGLIFFQSREPSRVFSSTNPKVSINSCV